MLAFEAHLVPELDLVRLVERADRHRDVRTAERAVVERRSAIGAEAARREIGAVELGGLTARPGQMLVADADQCGKEVAGRLLAHAAVADVRIVAQRRRMEADGATLAAARERACGHFAFGHCPAPGVQVSVSWSGSRKDKRMARISRSSSVVPIGSSASCSAWPTIGWRLS